MKYELMFDNDGMYITESIIIEEGHNIDTKISEIEKIKKLFNSYLGANCLVKEENVNGNSVYVIKNETTKFGEELIIPASLIMKYDDLQKEYLNLSAEQLELYNFIREFVLSGEAISLTPQEAPLGATAARAGVMDPKSGVMRPATETLYMSKKDLADFKEKAKKEVENFADNLLESSAKKVAYVYYSIKDFIDKTVSKKFIIRIGAMTIVAAITVTGAVIYKKYIDKTDAALINETPDIVIEEMVTAPEVLTEFELRYEDTKEHQVKNEESNLGEDIDNEKFDKIVSFIESSTGQKIKQSADLHGIDPYVMYAISNYMTNLNENAPFSVYADGRVSIGTDAETGLDTYGHLKTEDKLQNIDYNIHAMTKIYQDSIAKFNGNTAFAMLDSVVGMDLVTLVVANNASDSNLTFDDYCKNYGVKDITDDLEKLNNNSLEIYLSGLNGTVLEKYKNTIAWLRNSGYNSQTFKVADILKGLESNYLGVTSENVVIRENNNQDDLSKVEYNFDTGIQQHQDYEFKDLPTSRT